ncbi:MAG: VWA domain-containing protein, partial [Chitinophagales bacterium]
KKYFAVFISLSFTFFVFAQDVKDLGYVFNQTTYSLGEIAVNQYHTAIFNFTNKTNTSTSLSPILREVDLNFVYPKTQIQPDESIIIKVIYFPKEEGLFIRQFPVYFEGYEDGIILTIIGDVTEEEINVAITDNNTVNTTPVSIQTLQETVASEVTEPMVDEVEMISPEEEMHETIVAMEQTLSELRAKHNKLIEILNANEEDKIQKTILVNTSPNTTPCDMESIKEMESVSTELAIKYLALETTLLQAGILEEPIKIEPEPEKPIVTDLVLPKLSEEEYAANNILFLIDISNSMKKENKIDLLKTSIKNLALVLRDIDKVSIITYNQKNAIALESVSGDNTNDIYFALDNLRTSGLTYGVSGIQNAYDVLQNQFIADGNNQIILATDGLFSKVNATMTENELNKLVKNKANNEDIILSVIGFGENQTGIKLMEKLAKNGKGQFIQIDNESATDYKLIQEIKENSQK